MSLPETLTMSFSSSGLRRSLAMGGGGKGLLAMGTHPMAAARAKGNQAATDAILPAPPPLATLESPMLWGAILIRPMRTGLGLDAQTQPSRPNRWMSFGWIDSMSSCSSLLLLLDPFAATDDAVLIDAHASGPTVSVSFRSAQTHDTDAHAPHNTTAPARWLLLSWKQTHKATNVCAEADGRMDGWMDGLTKENYNTHMKLLLLLPVLAASIGRSLAWLRSVAANPTGRSGNGCVALYWQYPEGAGMQAALAFLFLFLPPFLESKDDVIDSGTLTRVLRFLLPVDRLKRDEQSDEEE
ncbi:hypothetical protein OUZ56_028543 [Daphnia magna]|uniref:Uncharacterized protein n=1 Tax=Daphnia magna TaxID=35525 RepID=A0ABR0B457_9CRUS|nr:hypothetical protein OUZ56_028543 [Daphnia magna]